MSMGDGRRGVDLHVVVARVEVAEGPTVGRIGHDRATGFRHGGNPVLRWMADNMKVTTNPNGNIMPDKAKSVEKIDGMVALIMGLDRAMKKIVEPKSPYGERGLESI